MFCTACGTELDSQNTCPRCASIAPAEAPIVPTEPFVPAAHPVSRWKLVVFTLLSIVLCALVLFLNYLRALRWAGVINAESGGYMMGGVIFSSLLGLFMMYLVGKGRRKKTALASKFLGVASVAFLFSLFGFAMETGNRWRLTQSDAYHKVGTLLKEAAGKQPLGKDAEWWDAPLRDFFQDILEMNQHYSAEVAAFDKTAIKNLYSVDSYAGNAHMARVVSQLRAALAVDEKYASLDTIIQRMRDRVSAANATEKEKQDFLNGMNKTINQSLYRAAI